MGAAPSLEGASRRIFTSCFTFAFSVQTSPYRRTDARRIPSASVTHAPFMHQPASPLAGCAGRSDTSRLKDPAPRRIRCRSHAYRIASRFAAQSKTSRNSSFVTYASRSNHFWRNPAPQQKGDKMKTIEITTRKPGAFKFDDLWHDVAVMLAAYYGKQNASANLVLEKGSAAINMSALKLLLESHSHSTAI